MYVKYFIPLIYLYLSYTFENNGYFNNHNEVVCGKVEHVMIEPNF